MLKELDLRFLKLYIFMLSARIQCGLERTDLKILSVEMIS